VGETQEPADDIERQLRIELMRANIENKRADTRYKLDLSRWEPWKVLAAGFGAGAAMMAAAVGLVAAVFPCPRP
jgi:translation initiation factor 2 gamma subunit (eIF-2gamma)